MLQQKQKDYNWYYTQCFVREIEGKSYPEGNRTVCFVTFARTPDEAKDLAMNHVMAMYKDRGAALAREDIHLYQKNYIRNSRAMVQAGQYCGVKPEFV